MRSISFQDLFVKPLAPPGVAIPSQHPLFSHSSSPTLSLFPPTTVRTASYASLESPVSDEGKADAPTPKGSIGFILGDAHPPAATVKMERSVVEPQVMTYVGQELRLAAPTSPTDSVTGKRGAPELSAATGPKRKKKRKARICKELGCDKYVVDHGLCIRHGVREVTRMYMNQMLFAHTRLVGGYTICKIDGCAKRAKSRGICWSHGGGTRCKTDGCAKIAVSLGRCWAHGGGKRCLIETCRKPASERTNNFCSDHFSWYHHQEQEALPEAPRYMAQ
ncbi:hypothetical protein BBJ28_00011818 [Nothophytophthora sp. Chile5]|nr:hypothetical protein BBJ28_00011818 [Nothophytophthora sp. Chile5]